MLAKGMQILLHPTDILTAIRHEHNLLILLHPLGLHQLPQSPSRFLVVGLNEPETLRRGYFALIVPPKSDKAFARDHFEPSLLVRRPNVTAIDAHRDRTIGCRLSFPVLFRALEPIKLALLTQLPLDAFCRQLQVVSDGLRIHQITHRQHFLQQIRRSCKRDQGCPLRLQIEHFWAGLPVEPGPHWTERPGTLRLAATSVPSRIGHLNSAEYRANRGAAGVLGRVPPAAVWTSTSLLQLYARLLGDYKILHACQQRFALGQIHAKRFHRQFLPLDRQDLPALFLAVGV